MDDPTVVLRVECGEPEGKVVRTVRLARLSINNLRRYYEASREHDVLFNDFIEDDFEGFLSQFFIQIGSEIQPAGVIWEVDDVGIIRLTDIMHGTGVAHFSFWDGRLRGREPIIREMAKYVFRRFALHRIEAEIPLYSKPSLKFIERCGFVKEGRKRDAVLYNGEWFDVNLYSILEGEVE